MPCAAGSALSSGEISIRKRPPLIPKACHARGDILGERTCGGGRVVRRAGGRPPGRWPAPRPVARAGRRGPKRRDSRSRKLGTQRLAPFGQRFARDPVLARELLDGRQPPLDGIGALRIMSSASRYCCQAVAGLLDAYFPPPRSAASAPAARYPASRPGANETSERASSAWAVGPSDSYRHSSAPRTAASSRPRLARRACSACQLGDLAGLERQGVDLLQTGVATDRAASHAHRRRCPTCMLRLSSVSQTPCAGAYLASQRFEFAVAIDQRALRRRPHQRLNSCWP